MPTPPTPSIRELLLTEIRRQEPQGYSGPTLQQASILNAVAGTLGIRQDPDREQAILTEWGELFRTGLLAWGLNLSNPNPPFFHLTERGRHTLQNLSRDPSNPAGYLRHLSSIAQLDEVALSYLREALDCYVTGLFKAAAVMVGGAAERVILILADNVIQKLTSIARPVPRELNDWRIKTVTDGLHSLFDGQRTRFTRELRESFEAYWSAFAQQIRTTRNDAGHPESVDPVTPDTVHASLLVFPELARVAEGLMTWVRANLT